MRLHGAIDISQIKHTWKGDWNPSTIYNLNDVVKYNGMKFVCIDTELSDSRKYGNVYKPTVANEYWQEFSYGYLWRGGWNWKDHYYPGDVVKWNSDWYICNTYNYGGHPVYENSSLTTKWTKIMSSGDSANKKHNHLQFANYDPMGWTKNHLSNGHDSSFAYTWQDNSFATINGNYELSTIGRGGNAFGGAQGTNNHLSRHSTMFDFWDYFDGYRTSITGGAPKLIQVIGSWNYSMYLFDSGELYAAGYDGNYQLGTDDATTRRYPLRVGRTISGSPYRRGGVLRDVFIVKCDASHKGGESTYIHCLALDSDGQVWSWGYNGYGQLGLGHVHATGNFPRVIDKKFFDGAKIVNVWAEGTGSYGCSFALDENGQTWAWGYSLYGVLGIGNYSQSYCVRPVKMQVDWTLYGGLKKVIYTGNSTNNHHGGIALTNDGTMWSWGGSLTYAGAAKGAGWAETYVPRPEKMATLLDGARQGSLGDLNQTQLRQLGRSIEVTNNVEDFWAQGYGNLGKTILKEKITGQIFASGINHASSLPISRQQANTAEADSNTNWSNLDMAFFNPIDIGNFTDVKDVMSYGGDVANSDLLWLNADGRAWVTGDNVNQASRGIGLAYQTDAFDSLGLPWEKDVTEGPTPTQVRNLENISMLQVTNGTYFAAAALTTDNQIRVWGYLNTYFTPGEDLSLVNNPMRLHSF